MVPLLAFLAEDPLLSVVVHIVGFMFFEINLLAVVAILLILISFGAQITEPGVLVSMNLATSPPALRAFRQGAEGLQELARADLIFAETKFLCASRGISSHDVITMMC